MKKHVKKIMAPVIIVMLVVLYNIFVFGIIFSKLDISKEIKIALLLLSLIGIGIVVYVLIERIKEIRSGEEDDLSKY